MPVHQLPPYRKPRPITMRTIALLYLPTVGLWSLVRAFQFYRKGWK